jgi:succinate dehydrogenase/fumarate reductase-like Fe-S protein
MLVHRCGPMVLDALIKIKGEQDSTLTFRRCVCVWNCSRHVFLVKRMAVCPSHRTDQVLS